MSLLEAAMLIAGSAAGGASRWIERENPARADEIVGRVPLADDDDVRRATAAAAQAFETWRRVPALDRAERLAAGAQAASAAAGDLAPLMARETGKPVADCRGEIGFAITYLLDVARRAPGLVSPADRPGAHGRLRVARRPFGVVAAVTPWNAPVILAATKVGPAVASGNTVVVKPSPLAPFAVTGFLTRLAEALPPGVVGVVHGDGATARALASDPLVRKAAFTGGTEAGAAIARAAGPKPLLLELGGNDPAIVLEDAELTSDTIGRLVLGTFLTAGQVCMAAKRLYVHRSIIDTFVDAYVDEAARRLVTGDPLDEDVTVGPLATREGRDRLLQLLDGTQSLQLGSLRGDPSRGWFVQPRLVPGLPDDHPLVATEQFGPAVPVLPFDGEDEVVRRANATPHGLASSVWSADTERAFALADRLDAGVTFVNTCNRMGMSLDMPFGGTKASGFGREYGDEGVLEYTQTHATTLPAAVRAGSYPGAAT